MSMSSMIQEWYPHRIFVGNFRCLYGESTPSYNAAIESRVRDRHESYGVWMVLFYFYSVAHMRGERSTERTGVRDRGTFF